MFLTSFKQIKNEEEEETENIKTSRKRKMNNEKHVPATSKEESRRMN